MTMRIYLAILCIGVTAFVNVNADYNYYSDSYEVEDDSNIEQEEKNKSNIENVDKYAISSEDYSLDFFNESDTDKKTFSKEINEQIDEEKIDNTNKENNIVNKDENEIETAEINNMQEETKPILIDDIENDFADGEKIANDANKELLSNNQRYINETTTILNETQDTFDETNAVDNESGIEDIKSSFKLSNDNYHLKIDNFISDLAKLGKTYKGLMDEEENDNELEFSKTQEDINSSEDDAEYEKIDDENLDKIFIDEKTPKKVGGHTSTPKIHKVEPLSDDSVRQSFYNDDLFANAVEKSQNIETTKTFDETTNKQITSTESVNDVKIMSESETDVLLTKYSDKNLKNLISKVREYNNPKKIWLNVDKPTVVTSPEYPKSYPANSVSDWIFEGDGTGIEFNITDCDINGDIGDYLLVIPGSVDSNNRDGLLFTYYLKTERWYRFLDVDWMFMRFEAKPGAQSHRGFSVSAKMLAKSPQLTEPEPEPMPSVRGPVHTLTLNLGGVTLEGFLKIEEYFRQIVADMASTYAESHNITSQVNDTLDVTQITSRALCYHNWPKYEMCAEVRFGVPLFYEDEENYRLNEDDLRDMWFTYSKQDEFAARLRSLGITEFQVPNDKGVLIVWLVIAGGVVISMAMLAFALWRFSCFEDYTRMATFSDADSISEKRKLDMFPTPHQTLPPLYTEADYKWADTDNHKVNMVGYSNSNYLQDDMFDIESDDEVQGKASVARDVCFV